MKLSILIPMYNAQDYIGNCLNSLLNQNLSDDNYEILIIDDGSIDNSVQIVKKYIEKHSNISLFLEENSGTAATRNKLLKLAKGNYIYFIDADDYIVYNCIGGLLEIAESNALDILGFKSIDTYDLNQFELQKSINKANINPVSGAKFIGTNTWFTFGICWYFLKRDILEENGVYFNESVKVSDDVIFTTTVLLKAKKMFLLPNEIHRYVLTGDSLMRSSDVKVVSKRIDGTHIAGLYLNSLINNLKAQLDTKNDDAIKNLEFRRDVLNFFNITDMARKNFSKKDIKTKIDELRGVGAYPFSDFLGTVYKSFKFRTLISLVNNEWLLYPAISFYKFFVGRTR